MTLEAIYKDPRTPHLEAHACSRAVTTSSRCRSRPCAATSDGVDPDEAHRVSYVVEPGPGPAWPPRPPDPALIR